MEKFIEYINGCANVKAREMSKYLIETISYEDETFLKKFSKIFDEIYKGNIFLLNYVSIIPFRKIQKRLLKFCLVQYSKKNMESAKIYKSYIEVMLKNGKVNKDSLYKNYLDFDDLIFMYAYLNNTTRAIFFEDQFKIFSEFIEKSKIGIKDVFEVVNYLVNKRIEDYEESKRLRSKKANLITFVKAFDFRKKFQPNDYEDDYLIDNLYNYKRYCDIGDEISSEDLDKMLGELIQIGFTESIIEKIIIYFNQRKEEIIEEKSKQESKKIKIDFKIDSKDTFKERIELEEELAEVYDEKQKMCLRVLNLEEVRYYLEIMKKLRKDEGTRRNFLRFNEYKINQESAVEKYKILIDKFRYYVGEIDYKEKLELLDYFYECLNSASQEEYDYITETMDLLINEILDMIPPTYEYEYKNLSMKNDRRLLN